MTLIKRPARDTCLYMGEATPLVSPVPPDLHDPPDPHFLFIVSSYLVGVCSSPGKNF